MRRSLAHRARAEAEGRDPGARRVSEARRRGRRGSRLRGARTAGAWTNHGRRCQRRQHRPQAAGDSSRMIGVVGDFNPRNETHLTLVNSLGAAHARSEWIPTDRVPTPNELWKRYSGLWIAPASP